MNITPLQSDFSVGEVAPDVQYRSTLDARNRGVLTARNMITDSRGPIIKRNGFRFLGIVGEPAVITPCNPDLLTYEHEWSYNTPETDFETNPSGTIMSPDGDIIVMASGALGGRGKGFYVFRLDTPYDLTSIQPFNYPADWFPYSPPYGDLAGNSPADVHIDTVTGTNMFSTDSESENTGGGGGSADRVFKMVLNGFWDLTNYSEVQQFILPSGIVGPGGPFSIDVSTDGFDFYIVMNNDRREIHQFSMSIPWNLDSASYTTTVTLTDLPSGFFIRGVRFDRSGERFLLGGEFNTLRFYKMSIPWDLSTYAFDKELTTSATITPYWPTFIDNCNYLLCTYPLANAFQRYAAG